jgi:hypothetical protein
MPLKERLASFAKEVREKALLYCRGRKNTSCSREHVLPTRHRTWMTGPIRRACSSRSKSHQGFTKAQIEAEIGDLYIFIRASIDRQNRAQGDRLAKDKQ